MLSQRLRLSSSRCSLNARDVRARGMRRSPVITPDVISRNPEAMPVDIYNYLLQQRIVCLNGYVNDRMATQIVGSLMALEQIDEKEPIRLYINCSGGQPYSVFGILDTIKTLKPELHTYGLGACYSYASLILASGTKGKRYSMKNTRIMMSQPMGGSQGDMYQVQKTVEELNAIYQMVARYYMSYTGMDQDEVEKATCRDNFFTPEEAQLYGLIDHVIGGQGDRYLPYSVVKKFRDSGLIDDLSQGLLGL